MLEIGYDMFIKVRRIIGCRRCIHWARVVPMYHCASDLCIGWLEIWMTLPVNAAYAQAEKGTYAAESQEVF